MVGVLEADEAGALRLAPLRPPLEGHLQRDLDRGRAAVGVEHARQPRRRERDQPLGQLDRRLRGRGRASSSGRRGRAGRGSPRRWPGGGGRGRCTTATRRRRCRRCRRCRRGSCRRRGRSRAAAPRRTSPRCWVNGCQRWRRSAAMSSAVERMIRTLASASVGSRGWRTSCCRGPGTTRASRHASQRSSGSAAPAAASAPAAPRRRRQRRDLDLAEPRDRVPVGAHASRRLGRPRRQHDRAHAQAAPARGLERQQRVVDRAEPGARGDDQRQSSVGGQVADVVRPG